MTAEKGKCPPQFVFEMMVAQATRLFLFENREAEAATLEISEAFEDFYDNEDLFKDLSDGMERLVVYIGSVELSDVDLFLLSFIWFKANFEAINTPKKKKGLFANPLKGQPKRADRCYQTALAFKGYATAVGNKLAQVRPEEWKPTDEVEFEEVFSRLFPEAFAEKDEKNAS